MPPKLRKGITPGPSERKTAAHSGLKAMSLWAIPAKATILIISLNIIRLNRYHQVSTVGMHPAPLIHVAHMVMQINIGLRPDPVHSTLQEGIVTEMNRNPMA
jgi:hypothetical protein